MLLEYCLSYVELDQELPGDILMVPEGKILQVNQSNRESIQAKILKMRFHTNARGYSVRIAFKCELQHITAEQCGTSLS